MYQHAPVFIAPQKCAGKYRLYVTLSFAHALYISVSDLSQLFDTWNPGSSLPARLKRMTADDFCDFVETRYGKKGYRLVYTGGCHKNINLAVIPAVATLMDEWIQTGHGKDDRTIIGKVE